MPGKSSTHDVATMPGTSAAEVDSADEYSVDSDSEDLANVTAAGLPSNVDTPRAGAAENELEAASVA
jgi:hypothetical protein